MVRMNSTDKLNGKNYHVFSFACIDHKPSFSYSPAARTYYLVLGCLSIIFSLATILLNLLFILTVITRRRIRTRPVKLLSVLASSDLIQGVIIWPMITATMFELQERTLRCWFSDIIGTLGFGFGLLTMSGIFVIAMEQYIAIVHPYTHKKLVHMSCILSSLFVPWTVLFLVNISIMFGAKAYWGLYKMSLTAVMGIMLLLLCYFFAAILITVQRIGNRISATNATEGHRIKKQARASKTTAIILITYLACYFPVCAYTIYELVYEENHDTVTYGQMSTEIIALSNSVWNPFVYYWRLSSVRKATKRLLCSWKNTVEDMDSEAYSTATTLAVDVKPKDSKV